MTNSLPWRRGDHQNAPQLIESVLIQGYVSSSRDALAKLLGGLEPVQVAGEDASDVSAAVITRTTVDG